MKKYLTRVLTSALALPMVVTIAPSELGYIVWTLDIGHRMISQRNIQAAK